MTNEDVRILQDWLEERGFEPPQHQGWPWLHLVGEGVVHSSTVDIPASSVVGVVFQFDRISVFVHWDSEQHRVVPRESPWVRTPSVSGRLDQVSLDVVLTTLENALNMQDWIETLPTREHEPIPKVRGEVPEDMGQPRGLSHLGKIAWATLVNFFKKNRLMSTGGGKVFYSPQEWAARGELYAKRSVLVVVYDGGAHRSAMTLDAEQYDLNEEMQQALRDAGFYFEEGTGWYGGVYAD